MRKKLFYFFVLALLVSCSKIEQLLEQAGSHSGNPVKNGLSKDQSVWPNTTSYTNSDAWLMKNHDKIKTLKPRVLVIDFYNKLSRETCGAFLNKVVNAMAEGSRFQAYKNSSSSAQLQYTIVNYLDLRDGSGKDVSDKRPHHANGTFDEAGLFSDAFAAFLGYKDAGNKRWLRLGELFDKGIINECWVIAPGTLYEAQGRARIYDDNFGFTGQYDECLNACYNFGEAGKQTSVTIRLGEINPDRGPGCATHAFGHAIEHLTSDIPYFKKVADRFFNFNLDRRYGAPFNSLYQAPYNANPPECFSYPTPGSITTVNNYLPDWTYGDWGRGCGNIHFPTNGKNQYDYFSTQTVLCSCENYGKRNAKSGYDLQNEYNYNLASRWNNDAYGDCGGEFMIYLRQNMPGYNSGRTGDDGNSMKSWWPFLYY